MSGLSMLLVLLATTQEPKPAELAAERARRADVVDKIILQPPKLEIRIGQGAFEQVGPGILRRTPINRSSKLLTLEQKSADLQRDGRGVPVNIREMALSSDNFDRWLFNDSRTEEGRRDHLGSMLTERLHELLKAERPIAPDDLPKLQLAGQGDIKRYLDRVEGSRIDFELARQDYEAGRQALGQLEPLSAEYQAGPFGMGSCFEKTLRKLVSEREVASRSGK